MIFVKDEGIFIYIYLAKPSGFIPLTYRFWRLWSSIYQPVSFLLPSPGMINHKIIIQDLS
jgi:hypothetical protein